METKAEKVIFIPGNVPSLKNSKVKTGKGIFHSKTVQNYLRQLGIQSYSPSKKIVKEYKTRENEFRKAIGNYFDNAKYPLIIKFHFVRNSKRQFDIINVQQIILDLLTAHNFIADDNADCIIPAVFRMNNNYYTIDKNKPGVFLK